MTDIRALLEPCSIAVVGASEAVGPGRNVLGNLQQAGFEGEIVPVNPKYASVAGLPCVPDLSRLPHPVDLLVIAIPAEAVPAALGKMSPGAAGAAIVLSAGFGEAGEPGRKLEKDVQSAARDLGLRLCGPNCLGIINVRQKVAAYSARLRDMPPPGPIGYVSQSGTVCIGVTNARADLGFSFIISAGNETDVKCDEYVRFLVDDPGTGVIALFLEGVRSPRAFLDALDRAREAGKPVVVLKAGRSEGGRRATLAHTGSLAGSEEVFRGLFAQKSAIQVLDLDEQLATLGLLSQGRRPLGRGVGIVTVSGGQSALICDAAEDIGLELPDPVPETREKLRAVLPGFAAISNPLDVTGVGVVRRELYEDSLRILAEDPGTHLVAVLQDVVAGLGPDSRKHYHGICKSTVHVARSTHKPVALFTQFSGTMDPEMVETLRAGNVPLLQGLVPGLRSVQNWIRYSEKMRGAVPRRGEADSAVSDEGVVARLRSAKGPLTERESKEVLSRAGIPVTREALAGSEEEALDIAESIGFPVVLKVDSPDLPHKTEAGAVRLGLTSREELRGAYREILQAARLYRPDARINGVLVQEQVPAGVEVIVGLATDPQFGKTLLMGLGGVLAEILKDVSVRLVPVSRRDAQEMLDEVRASHILKGVRGRPPSDRGAIIDALLALSRFGRLYGDLVEEVDINPLIVGPEGRGARAADALIVPRA
ncbi:MAG: acetate--CoA ligase family protein [Candidatus Tectomicrobia bacterium]|nr:acetate--CoA ligase family protein [Candidatus Tectomicrobia bacterium]